ncbi:MAG: methyltransferase domain-containing protein [Chloroflexi bacterium]|nr:methyltransferase domain-containing protein [Chloroflexota bacterium]
MRREHLERLQPVCPACRASGRPAAALRLGTVVACEDDDADIREGVLVCTEPVCQREHPIVDGIPIVVSDLSSWAAHQLNAVLWRSDLSPFTESLLGDAAGPASEFERQRTTLSAYGRVHWGDFDAVEPLESAASLAGLLAAARELLDAPPTGIWLDLGCAAGRATYETALAGRELVVGVDLSFAMLRVAEGARRTGRAVFPIRRVGLVFDRCEVVVPQVPAERMAYWCCDVDNLPFGDAGFDGALSLNVLDCVPSPVQHLVEMGRVLRAGASALLSTPYDWAATATPVAQWLGGHSQRSEAHGSSAAELRRALRMVDTGLAIAAERDRVPWRVYVNERASMDYAVHVLRLARRERPE